VGADPSRIAILDNFCWGYTDRAETLGSLVRAALACHDLAVAFGTPFISGKDSLNNEFSYLGEDGQKRTIAIPPSLLISALGQVDDVSRCVTMDLKEAGNLLYQVGTTEAELGGSHFALVAGLDGGAAPRVNAAQARRSFESLHKAISAGLVRACHDLSEGGLAVAAAEMAFAGGLGATLHLQTVPHGFSADSVCEQAATLLFSESNSRFLCEVPRVKQAEFERLLAGVPLAAIGEVRAEPRLRIFREGDETTPLIDAELATLKEAWQKPLRW
jgi:phosphoribosylformylglycinamidine synthase subunit PurSL